MRRRTSFWLFVFLMAHATLALDSTPPAVNGFYLEHRYLYTNGTLGLFVNASDDVNVSSVWAALAYPNGTSRNLSAMLSGGTAASGTWQLNLTSLTAGTYYIPTIFLNDTSGNPAFNSTENSTYLGRPLYFEVVNRSKTLVTASIVMYSFPFAPVPLITQFLTEHPEVDLLVTTEYSGLGQNPVWFSCAVANVSMCNVSGMGSEELLNLTNVSRDYGVNMIVSAFKELAQVNASGIIYNVSYQSAILIDSNGTIAGTRRKRTMAEYYNETTASWIRIIDSTPVDPELKRIVWLNENNSILPYRFQNRFQTNFTVAMSICAETNMELPGNINGSVDVLVSMNNFGQFGHTIPSCNISVWQVHNGTFNSSLSTQDLYDYVTWIESKNPNTVKQNGYLVYADSGYTTDLCTAHATPQPILDVSFGTIYSGSNYLSYGMGLLALPDSTPPVWSQTPQNQSIEYGSAFYYDLNATDDTAVDRYWLNDSVNFKIDPLTGVVENNTLLGPGTYLLNVSVNDTSGNLNSSLFAVAVLDTIVPNITVWSTNGTSASNPQDIMFLVGVGESVLFNVSVTDISTLSYQWLVNKLDQNRNANNFSFTIPSCDHAADPSGCIWEIHLTVNDSSGNEAHREWVVSNLSLSEAPVFFDFFTDLAHKNRTDSDPWGRPLRNWTDYPAYPPFADGSKGFMRPSGTLDGRPNPRVNLAVPYGTWKFRYRFPDGDTGAWGYSFYYAYQSGVNYNSYYGKESDTHHHSLVPAGIPDGPPFSIDYDGGGWSEDGQWHQVTVIRTNDTWVYMYVDGLFEYHVQDLLWGLSPDRIMLDFMRYAGSEVQFDGIEVYNRTYLFPKKNASFGPYVSNYYHYNYNWYPLKRNGTIIRGRGVTLLDVANSINNASLFSYNASTRTAVAATDIVVDEASELVIDNETLRFNSTYGGQFYFVLKYASRLGLSSGMITSDGGYFTWDNAGSTTHFGHELTLYYPPNAPSSGVYRSMTPWPIDWSFFGSFTAIDSIINNSAHLFFDSPYVLNVSNTRFLNLRELDPGNYSVSGSWDTERVSTRNYLRGNKSFWIYTDDLNVNTFSLRNVSFSGGGIPLNLTFMINAHRDRLNVYDLDAAGESVVVAKSLPEVSGQSHTCYQDGEPYTNPYEYGGGSFLSSHIGFVNGRFGGLEIASDLAGATPKYYLDVLVRDAGGIPVQNSSLYLNNEVGGADFAPENIVIERPWAVGEYECFYHHFRIVEGQPVYSAKTGADGHTPLPSDRQNSVVLADYTKTREDYPYKLEVRWDLDDFNNSVRLDVYDAVLGRVLHRWIDVSNKMNQHPKEGATYGVELSYNSTMDSVRLIVKNQTNAIIVDAAGVLPANAGMDFDHVGFDVRKFYPSTILRNISWSGSDVVLQSAAYTGTLKARVDNLSVDVAGSGLIENNNYSSDPGLVAFNASYNSSKYYNLSQPTGNKSFVWRFNVSFEVVSVDGPWFSVWLGRHKTPNTGAYLVNYTYSLSAYDTGSIWTNVTHTIYPNGTILQLQPLAQVSGVNPNESWYRPDPNVPTYTVNLTINYTKTNLSVNAGLNATNITVTRWNLSLPQGQTLVNFTAESVNGNNVNFTVCSLVPSANYTIKRDASAFATKQADSSGCMWFTNSVWTSHVFTVQESGSQSFDNDPLTFWVRTDGNDTCTGQNNMSFADNSTSCAWKTIQNAASNIAAGQTARVQSGTYLENIVPSNSGTAGNWIKITTDGPVNLSNTGTAFSIVDKAYLTVSGNWHVAGYDGASVFIGGDTTKYVTVSGLKIVSTVGDGIFMGDNLTNIIVENSSVTNINSTNYAHGITYQGYATGGLGKNITIRHNSISGTKHNGIDINTFAQDVIIENNLLWDISGQTSVFLHNYGITRVYVRNNVIYLNSTDPNRQAMSWTGVNDSIFENNTIIGNGGGKGLVIEGIPASGCSGEPCKGSTNGIVRNNNFSGVFDSVIEVFDSYDLTAVNSNILFENNTGDRYWFVGTDNGQYGMTIRNPVNSPTDIFLQNAITNSTIEYMDGSVSSGNLSYYPTKSNKSISGITGTLTYTKYNMTARPSSGYATITTDGQNLTSIQSNLTALPSPKVWNMTIWSNYSNTAATFNLTTGLSSKNFSLYRNGSLYANVTTNSTGGLNYKYAGGGFGTLEFSFQEVYVAAGAAPIITLWSNNITRDNSLSVTLNETESIRFNVTVDQSVNYTWYKSYVWYGNATYSETRTVVVSNQSNWTWVTDSQTDGDWNISVVVENANGTDSKWWNVTVIDEIQKLVNDVPESNYGTIVLEPRIYWVNTVGGITLRGNMTLDGNSSIIRKVANGSCIMFQGLVKNRQYSDRNIVVRNLTVDGNSANQTCVGGDDYDDLIQISADNVTFEGLFLRNGKNDGITQLAPYDWPMKNVMVRRITSNAMSHADLFLTGENVTIKDVSSNYSGNSPIRFGNIKNVLVQNAVLMGPNNYCIQLDNTGSSYYFTRNVTFSNVSCADSVFAGIFIGSLTPAIGNTTNVSLSNVVIKNARLSASTDGIQIYNSRDILLSNFVVHYARRYGIYASSPNDSGIRVKNSIITDADQYGMVGNLTSSYNDVWNNTLGNYNGTSAGTGDISADPLFANASSGNFHLKSQAGRWNGSGWVNDSVTSPAIGAGDPSSDNSQSSWGGRIEIGAYGNTPEASKPLSQSFDNDPLTFWVRTDGNDTCSGQNNMSFAEDSTDCSWLTIQKAADTLTAGQTVRVQEGIYYENVTISVGGTSSNRINFTASGNVVLDGRGSGTALDITADNVTIDGFKAYNYVYGAKLYYRRNVTVKNSEFINISDDIIAWRQGKEIRIENNYLQGLKNYQHGIFSHGYPSNDTTSTNDWIYIINNTVKDTSHNGIDLHTKNRNVLVENNTLVGIEGSQAIFLHNFGEEDITIRGNRVYDSTRGIFVEGARNVIIENNYFYNYTAAYGIIFWCENVSWLTDYANTSDVQDVIVRNNTFNQLRSPVYAISFDEDNCAGAPKRDPATTAFLRNILFVNNTFLSNFTDTEIVVYVNITNVTFIDNRDPVQGDIRFRSYSGSWLENVSFIDTENLGYTPTASAPFRYYPSRAQADLNSTGGYSITFKAYPLRTHPASGYLNVTVNQFNSTTDRYNITVSSSDLENPTQFNLTAKIPGAFYNVKRDGQPYAMLQSGSDSVVRFFYNDTGSDWATAHTFEFSLGLAVFLGSPQNLLLTNNATIIFNCSAYSGSGLANLTLYGNWSGGWHANETRQIGGAGNSTTFTKTIIPDGSYKWNCLTFDSAGNYSFAVTNYTFTIDTTPPATITNLQNQSAGDTWIFWNWTNPPSDFDHVEVFLNGSWKTNTSNNFYNATGLNSGAWYEIQIRTVDSAGNVNGTWVNSTARTLADSTPPAIALLSPANTTYNYNRSLPLNFSVSEPASWCGYSLDGAPNVTIQACLNTTFNTSSGQHSLRLYANDTSGNLNSSVVYFSVDMLAPVISNVSSTVTSGSALIAWDSDEPADSRVYYGASVSLGLNRTDAALTLSHSVLLDGLSASTRYFYNVSSCDSVGNCNASSQYSFTTSSAGSNAPAGSPPTGGSAPVLASGGTKLVVLNKPDLRAVVSLKSELSNPSLVFTVPASLPLPAPPGPVYRYFNFTKSGFNNSDIANATIEFKVNKDWISEENIAQVYLARYSNGWTKLGTELVNSTGTHDTYRAHTGAFSYFAVVGERAVVVPEVSPSGNVTPVFNETFASNIRPGAGTASPVTQADIDRVVQQAASITPNTEAAKKILESARLKIGEAQNAFDRGDGARAGVLLGEAGALVGDASGIKAAVPVDKSGVFSALLFLLALMLAGYAYDSRRNGN